VSLTAPAKVQATPLTPAATSPVDPQATAKPVAVLRKSFDVYRQPAPIEIANASNN
jgi:hypothetical protein